MARRRRKKSSHRCRYGRSPYTGLCYQTSRRGRRKGGRRTKSSGKGRQAKPTPLWSDVVQYVRGGVSRFPCEADLNIEAGTFGGGARSALARRALDYLNAQREWHQKNQLTPSTAAKREASFVTARKQIATALKRGCGKKSAKGGGMTPEVQARIIAAYAQIGKTAPKSVTG